MINGYIYKLESSNSTITDVYVGSTMNFTKRYYQHKTVCNHTKNKNALYSFIRLNGNFDKWEMVLLESCISVDKLSLLKRERYWVENLNATLNTYVPSQTKKEWISKNIESINRKAEVRRTNNRFMLNFNAAVQIQCDCGSNHRRDTKSVHIRSKKHQNWVRMYNFCNR